MARATKGYWEKRSTELMLKLEKGTEKTINSLAEVYNQATKNINKEINEIYRNYASESGLSKEVLTSMLNKRETNTYYRNLLKTIENIKDEDVRKKLLAKYNAPAYAYRIKRFQALQDNIDVEIAKIADIEQTITKQRYIDTIQEGYYHNIYDIQKGLGYGFNFSQIDTKTINMMLNTKWADKGNYSTRIWKNADKLSQYMKINFTADTMSGKSISAMSKELANTLNIGLYKSTRLIRTEVNHFANESEMLSYEELGIKKYRFIATLDNVTCKHCASLDNRVFNVKDRQAGKNYPPIHPNDRCTTVAVFEDDIIEDLKRTAVDEDGNIIKVPQDMRYDEWYSSYVGTSDYVVKSNSNYKGINERLSIKQAVKTIPKQYRDLLKDVEFVIITQGDSNAVGNTIKILKGSTKYEVIHEIGHIISNKLRINNDSRYKSIIESTISDFTDDDIIFDPETFTKGIFRIDSKKFVTEYQGRIYQDLGFTDSTGKLNYKAFKDYFPEGLRMYYEDSKLLKSKNVELFNYIKDLMNNGKNI